MKTTFTCFIAILLWGFNDLKSQIVFGNYTVESWTVKNGLPADLILNITRDTNNFIWINTYEGLFQFDGVHFKAFSARTHPQFKSNNVYKPVVDKHNNLWITTSFGQLLKIQNGRIQTFAQPYCVEGIAFEFEDGRYLANAPNDRFVIFNPNTQIYNTFSSTQTKPLAQLLQKQPSIPYQMVSLDDGRKIFLKSKGLHWVTQDSLIQLDAKYGVSNPQLSPCSEIFKSSTGEIFLLTSDAVKIWQKDKFVTYPGCESITLSTLWSRSPLLVEDKKGNLWLGSLNGVALRRKGNKNFDFLPKNHPLSALIATTLEVDAENNVWVGSESGLYKITEGKIKVISQYLETPLKRTTAVTQTESGAVYINVNGVNSLFKYMDGKLSFVSLKSKLLQKNWEAFHLHSDKKGNLWVGSLTNLVSFKISPDGKETVFGNGLFNRYIYEDKDGKMWFGVPNKGIGYLDGDSLKFLKFEGSAFDGQSESSGVSSINKINGDEWLVTTFNYGLIWINNKGKVTSIRDTLGFPSIGAFETYQETYGTFWVVTNLGLYYFNGQTFLKIKDQSDILNNSFFSIIDDKRGSFWLTSNKGIVQVPKSELMDFVNGKIQTVNAARYDEGDGMLNRQCTGARHAILTKEGQILVPTLYGLAIVEPDKMIKNTLAPHVIVNSLYFNSKFIDSVAPVFDAGVHQYIIEYSATSYVAPNKVQFKYQLEGYDKDWSNPTTDRKVTYTNLPHGHYTFRVKACNNDGIWNETGASMVFEVNPYFYETWWFRLLFLCLLGGLIYTIMLRRSKQILERNKELQVQVDQRTKELNNTNNELNEQKSSLENTLTALKTTQTQLIQKEKLASLGELTAGIAHEIQNPLNFVNNFSELSVDLVKDLKEEMGKSPLTPEGGIIISSKDKEYIDELFTDLSQNQEKINHHGKRASSIVKGMLEHSRASTGVREWADINKLADEYLRLSYHGLRAKDKDFNADFSTQFDENLPKVEVIPQDIGRVLLNLINNAFYAVHQRATAPQPPEGENYVPTVIVSTHYEAPPSGAGGVQIIICVKDNGTGMPESVRAKVFQPFFTTKPTGSGTGLGLSLAYDIVTKGHGGTIEVISTEGVGTTFIVELPISFTLKK